MTVEQTVWGVHMQWDDGRSPPETKDIAIGWQELWDLHSLSSSRDAFKAAFTATFPTEKLGAVPVKAGVLYRFAKEIAVVDVVVYPSRVDRLVNIGLVDGDYTFLPSRSSDYPHRRRVGWKVHVPRAQFSQPALYEIGSAIMLFQISDNAEEFLAALNGKPFKAAEVDDISAAEIAVQAEESVEDFVIKQLSAELFEHFIAEQRASQAR